jgi:hypothetical protein
LPCSCPALALLLACLPLAVLSAATRASRQPQAGPARARTGSRWPQQQQKPPQQQKQQQPSQPSQQQQQQQQPPQQQQQPSQHSNSSTAAERIRMCVRAWEVGLLPPCGGTNGAAAAAPANFLKKATVGDSVLLSS